MFSTSDIYALARKAASAVEGDGTGHTVYSPECAPRRYVVGGAADRVDAAYLADCNELRRATKAWRKASPGDIVTTHYGLTGVLVNRGSIAGFIRPEGQDGAVRVEVADVSSIESA